MFVDGIEQQFTRVVDFVEGSRRRMDAWIAVQYVKDGGGMEASMRRSWTLGAAKGGRGIIIGSNPVPN